MQYLDGVTHIIDMIEHYMYMYKLLPAGLGNLFSDHGHKRYIYKFLAAGPGN